MLYELKISVSEKYYERENSLPELPKYILFMF